MASSLSESVPTMCPCFHSFRWGHVDMASFTTIPKIHCHASLTGDAARPRSKKISTGKPVGKKTGRLCYIYGILLGERWENYEKMVRSKFMGKCWEILMEMVPVYLQDNYGKCCFLVENDGRTMGQPWTPWLRCVNDVNDSPLEFRGLHT